uniref:Uncharacterized protein n=1 Tax=Oryza glumipatula TaxID=40148 RepID=A0A0D9YSC9_9ORYZ
MAILCHGSHTGVTPYTTQLRLGSVIRELTRGVPSFGGGWRHRRATATCLVANRRGAPEDTPPAATVSSNLDLEDSMDGGSLIWTWVIQRTVQARECQMMPTLILEGCILFDLNLMNRIFGLFKSIFCC